MHPLSVFPTLLSYSEVAPLILRVIVGIIFVDLGWLVFTTEKKSWTVFFEAIRFKPARIFAKALGIIQIIGGIMLITGLYTQVAALVFAIITAAECYIEMRETALLKRDIVFYVLLLAITVSLLVTGPGAVAFDLPL
jgi:putative oxidoreductase